MPEDPPTSTETAAPTFVPFPPGRIFGQYRIVRLLGQGGMGSVYEAVHMRLNKRVALKTLHPELVARSDLHERFVREGLAASKLDHPHVASVSDYGVEEHLPFLVMELLVGESFFETITREGALPVARTVELLVPVFAGVQAAHRAGIIHRDLKPENIFLAENALGEVVPKVLDFGISKLTGLEAGSTLTATGAVLGSSQYMSPEQVDDPRTVDARSDQFTLGVIVYEALTTKLPFDAPTVMEQLRRIHQARFAPPSTHRKGIPANLEGAITRAMAKNPDERFPSVNDFARALLAFGEPAFQEKWRLVLDTGPGGAFADTIVDTVAPERVHAASENTILLAGEARQSDAIHPKGRRQSFERAPTEIGGVGVPTWVVAAIAVGLVLMVLAGIVYLVG